VEPYLLLLIVLAHQSNYLCLTPVAFGYARSGLVKAWWPNSNAPTVSLRASELQVLLAQGNPIKVDIPAD